MMDKIRYFKSSEFDSPDAPGTGSQMNREFLVKLDAARFLAEIPFRINSGFRTAEHNRQVGGSSRSAHMKGRAADISCLSSQGRKIMLEALLKAGFNRIGINKTFIHVDDDPELPQNVIWVY